MKNDEETKKECLITNTHHFQLTMRSYECADIGGMAGGDWQAAIDVPDSCWGKKAKSIYSIPKSIIPPQL